MAVGFSVHPVMQSRRGAWGWVPAREGQGGVGRRAEAASGCRVLEFMVPGQRVWILAMKGNRWYFQLQETETLTQRL